jgi:hypothetical protein
MVNKEIKNAEQMKKLKDIDANIFIMNYGTNYIKRMPEYDEISKPRDSKYSRKKI